MQLAPAAPVSVPGPASGAPASGPSLSLKFHMARAEGSQPQAPVSTQTPPSNRNTRMSGRPLPRTPRTISEPSLNAVKHRTSPSDSRRNKASFTTSLTFPEAGQYPPPPVASSDEGAELQRHQRKSKVEAITKLDRGGTPVQPNTAGPSGTSFLPPSAQPQPIAGPSAARNPLHRQPVVNPPFSLDSVRTKAPRHPPSRSNSRLFGLQECPSYYPTEAQFRDPMAYITSISEDARKYGICKIVPPEGWQMPFSMSTETFKFRTRLQRLNQLEAASRAKINFLEQLSMFHGQQDNSDAHIPVIDRQPLDVWRLRKEVNKAGGHLELNRTEGWQALTEALGLRGAWWPQVKDAYMQIVFPFDKWATRAKSASASPFTPLSKTKGGQPPAFATATPPSPTAAARMSGMRASPRTRMGGKPALPLNPASIPQPDEIVRSVSAAPALQTPKIKVPGFSSRDGSESELSDEDSALSEESPVKKGQSPPEYQKGEICEVCRYGDAADKILLCDGCDRGFHTYCLDPPLAAVPSNEEWFCTSCLLSQGDDFGFEEGEDHSVASFQARDAAFSHAWWNRHRPPLSPGATLNAKLNPNPMSRQFGRVTVSEDDVEQEFWRLTESATETVEVEYGADVHSTTHGSAGPTMETHPLDPYASSPWNLNNMPILPDSLLRYIRSDISGMTVPWIYLGMMFSTFCWHNEDHYTYSVNYMYWGETKTWYGCSGNDAEKFEAAMKSEAPELFEQQPGLLFQLVTMMNPGRLQEAGVDVYACDQRPNEFVITFPKAYHCGFNHGINMNEAVNFALPDWLQDGKESVVRYKEYLKAPVFSHNELLITITLYSETIRTALWLRDSLNEMVEQETKRREKLRAICPTLTETIIEDDVPEEQYQCAACKGFCYLAQITCTCTKLVSCLDHADQLCECPLTKKTLRKRYAEAQLDEILAIVLARAALPENWRNRFYALLEAPRPPLKSMRGLVADADKIAYPIRESLALRALVDRANHWVERVSTVLTRKTGGRRRKGAKDEDDDMVDRSPEALRALLKEAERMAFDTPEIPQLRQALLSIESFQSQASVILSTTESELDLEKCKTVLILGESLNLDMPEITAIQTVVHRLEWFTKVEEEVDDRTLEYDDVLGLLRQAEEYQVPVYHPTVVELKKREQKGSDWLAAARKTLGASSIDLEDITSLIEGQELVPISAEVMRQLESIRKTVLNWQSSAKNLLSSNGSALAAGRLCKAVASASAPINRVHIPEIAALRVELDHHARWSEEMGKLLEVAPNKVANQINSIKRDFAATLQADDEEPNDDHSCYCRLPSGAVMVTCRTCSGEYHPRCVSISPKNASMPFQCEICQRLLPPIYPSLDRFMALVQPRRWNFILTPPEFAAAHSIAEMGLRAACLIVQLCDPNDVAIPQTNTDKLQHWIRKIYQLPLTFEIENIGTKERLVLVTQLFHRLQQAAKANLGLTTKPTKQRGRKARFVLAQSFPKEFHCICNNETPPTSTTESAENDVNMPTSATMTVTCFKCGQGYHASCVRAPAEVLEVDGGEGKVWRCPCCAVKEAKYYLKNVEVRVQLQDQLGTNEFVDYRATVAAYSIDPIRFTLPPEAIGREHILLECTNCVPSVPPEDHPNAQANANANANVLPPASTSANGVHALDNGDHGDGDVTAGNSGEPSRKKRKVRASDVAIGQSPAAVPDRASVAASVNGHAHSHTDAHAAERHTPPTPSSGIPPRSTLSTAINGHAQVNGHGHVGAPLSTSLPTMGSAAAADAAASSVPIPVPARSEPHLQLFHASSMVDGHASAPIVSAPAPLSTTPRDPSPAVAPVHAPNVGNVYVYTTATSPHARRSPSSVIPTQYSESPSTGQAGRPPNAPEQPRPSPALSPRTLQNPPTSAAQPSPLDALSPIKRSTSTSPIPPSPFSATPDQAGQTAIFARDHWSTHGPAGATAAPAPAQTSGVGVGPTSATPDARQASPRDNVVQIFGTGIGRRSEGSRSVSAGIASADAVPRVPSGSSGGIAIGAERGERASGQEMERDRTKRSASGSGASRSSGNGIAADPIDLDLDREEEDDKPRLGSPEKPILVDFDIDYDQ